MRWIKCHNANDHKNVQYLFWRILLWAALRKCEMLKANVWAAFWCIKETSQHQIEHFFNLVSCFQWVSLRYCFKQHVETNTVTFYIWRIRNPGSSLCPYPPWICLASFISHLYALSYFRRGLGGNKISAWSPWELLPAGVCNTGKERPVVWLIIVLFLLVYF